MNETDDSLEAELGAMRPREVSPELRRRIAGQLAQPSPSRSSSSWATPLAGGVLAAGLAAVLLLWLWRGPNIVPDQIVIESNNQSTVRFNGGLPTVWSYHNAIRRSSTDLEAVLGQHGQGSSQRQSVQVAAFTRSPAQLRTLIGEL